MQPRMELRMREVDQGREEKKKHRHGNKNKQKQKHLPRKDTEKKGK